MAKAASRMVGHVAFRVISGLCGVSVCGILRTGAPHVDVFVATGHTPGELALYARPNEQTFPCSATNDMISACRGIRPA